jgi:D-glycero-D-manno-heptose 1,7-bisphosphate phosphatase
VARPGVVLDRDGTLIAIVRDEELGVLTTAFHPAQLQLLPGVVEGLRALQDAGYVLAIATNQPGPAKGQCSAGAVHRTNAALVQMLADHGVTILRVEACLHHPEGGPGGDPALIGACACRKPRPGMLDALAMTLGLDASASWMLGDSAQDIDAGRAAGFRTGLVFDTRRCELCPLLGGASAAPDVVAPTLAGLAQAILLATR